MSRILLPNREYLDINPLEEVIKAFGIVHGEAAERRVRAFIAASGAHIPITRDCGYKGNTGRICNFPKGHLEPHTDYDMPCDDPSLPSMKCPTCGATDHNRLCATCRAAKESTRPRPFCDGCDHGVVAGHVCESCGGTGYAERRQSDRRKRVAPQPSRRLRALVDRQAKDDGLWFVARTAPEAYLQQELRKLHTLVEKIAPTPAT